MDIVLKEVKSKKDLRLFIHLPAKLHRNDPNWVPPVYADERIYFNPEKNKSFSYSDTILLLAFRNKIAVGRIMGIINHRYNDIKNERYGRFCYLEGYEDFEVASLLLHAIEDWAKKLGMDKLVGPFGFSDKDPQGFLLEGYEFLPVIATNYNSPAAIEFMTGSGYTKEVDLFVYKVTIPKEFPDFYKKILERVERNNEYKILEFKKRSEIKKLIRPIFTLINETFKDIYGFMPFEQKEMDDFASRYLAVIKPDFVKVIQNDGQCIAFIIGMPDISEGIIKAKGFLFPTGFIHILRSQTKTKRLVLLLGAIKEEYRGKGLNVILGTKMIESAWKQGFEYIDSHLELEENTKMRAEMEKMGGVPYKKYRVFQKSLKN